jgi:hypothetical protein
MPKSKRLTTLHREIGALRKQFLPDRFDPLGRYTDPRRAQAHTRAFIVLSHAEIESYLEEWAKEIARASETIWLSSKRITKPLAFLLATIAERISVPNNDTPLVLEGKTVKLFQAYYKSIKDNNGIRETNVFTLFGPLGVPAMALGATLLPNLNSLGDRRGKRSPGPLLAAVRARKAATQPPRRQKA